MIEIGNQYKNRAVVSEEMTARSIGSGDLPVLATPAMIALMENAAMLAVAPFLAENETTVGGYIECSHLAPTAMGDKVEAEAILEKIEGKALHFTIKALSGEKKIGEGHHIRYIVDRTRFLSKLKSPARTGLDEALEDVKDGRVYHAESVDDLFNQLNT